MVITRAQAKRNKEINTSETPDSISHRPPEIIEEILKHLPIKDLIRTSILSKQWRYKWTMIPCLVFDENCLERRAYKSVLTKKFARVITDILLKHQGPIHMFKFNLQYPIAKNVPDYINGWIDILKEKGISNLSIEMGDACAFEPKEPLFCCEKLEALKLKMCIFHTPASFNRFKRLKELHLEEVATTKTEFNQFTSQCPFLEKLTLINIGMKPLKVSIPSLKYLHIQGVFNGLRLENLGSLTYLLIQLSMTLRYVEYNRRGNTSVLESVLVGLCSLEKLELWSHSVKFLAATGVPAKLPFTLNHIEEMFLGMNVNNLNEISVALCLLRSSPRLKTLLIGEWWSPGNCSVCGSLFWKEQYKFNIRFYHLEMVILEDFCNTECEMEFISYILKHSPTLQTVKITVRRYISNEDFIKCADHLLGLAGEKVLILLRTQEEVDFEKGLSRERGVLPFLCN
ncbi:hypothetical protein ACHQM5_023269 [Ranunculus cassubicifolius]